MSRGGSCASPGVISCVLQKHFMQRRSQSAPVLNDTGLDQMTSSFPSAVEDRARLPNTPLVAPAQPVRTTVYTVKRSAEVFARLRKDDGRQLGACEGGVRRTHRRFECVELPKKPGSPSAMTHWELSKRAET